MITSTYEYEKIRITDYVVMFLILCISGNPLFVYADTKWLFVISAAVLALLCLKKEVPIYSRQLGVWLCISCVLFFIQFIILDLISIPADVNFLCRLWIAFLSVSFFGLKFRETYLRVMVFVCLVSIPLFLIEFITGAVFGIEFDRYKTLLIYNQVVIHGFFDTSVRNSGMFWEPGAFQGYIMLIPLLFYDKLMYLWTHRKKEVLVLLTAFILTLSTTAYITLFLFVGLTILTGKKIGIFTKTAIIACVCAIAVFFVWDQDFMGEKIIRQFEEAKEIQEGDVSWDRMGAMVVDFYNIKRHPLIGNGFIDESRYGAIGEFMHGAGNGLSGSINMFGIPFIILYFVALFKNYGCYPVAHRWIFLLVIALLLYGEYFLNYPLFWTLLFIKIPTNNEKNSSIINSI